MQASRLFYFLFFLFATQPAIAQSTYRLQPGDAIEIWVAQYSDLTREVALAPDGWISLPLAGTVKAEGMTLEALKETLTQRLQPFFKEAVGLNVSLVTSEVNRPSIFVSGAVESPGVYPFRPGMTVLHALSVAGGLYRANLPASDRARSTELEGLINSGSKRLLELSVMIARLNAQIAGERSFSVPDDVDAATAARFLSREQALLTMQQNSIAAQEAAITRLTQINNNSADAINDQLASLTERIKLAQERLATTAALVERGVLQISQVRDIEDNIIAMEGSLSQLRTTLASQQAGMLTEQSRFDIVTQEYQVGLINQLGVAEREREDLQASLSNYGEMLELYDPASAGTSTLLYEIVRMGEGGSMQVDATEQTTIFPGDLIRVTRTAIDPKQSDPPIDQEILSDDPVSALPGESTDPS